MTEKTREGGEEGRSTSPSLSAHQPAVTPSPRPQEATETHHHSPSPPPNVNTSSALDSHADQSLCGPTHRYTLQYLIPVVEQEFLVYQYADRAVLTSNLSIYFMLLLTWTLMFVFLLKEIPVVYIVLASIVFVLSVISWIAIRVLASRAEALKQLAMTGSNHHSTPTLTSKNNNSDGGAAVSIAPHPSMANNKRNKKETEESEDAQQQQQPSRDPAVGGVQLSTFFSPDNAIRVELRRNALFHELLTVLVHVVGYLFSVSIVVTLPECIGVEVSNVYGRFQCLNAIHSDVLIAMLFSIWASKRPPRFVYFAIELVALILLNVLPRVLQVGFPSNWQHYVVVSLLNAVVAVGTLVTAWFVERSTRRNFDRYVQEFFRVAASAWVKRQTEAALAAQVPLGMGRAAAIRDADGLWGFSAHQAVCCIGIQDYAPWSAMNSPYEVGGLLRKVVEACDEARVASNTTAPRYHALGDLYVIGMVVESDPEHLRAMVRFAALAVVHAQEALSVGLALLPPSSAVNPMVRVSLDVGVGCSATLWGARSVVLAGPVVESAMSLLSVRMLTLPERVRQVVDLHTGVVSVRERPPQNTAAAAAAGAVLDAAPPHSASLSLVQQPTPRTGSGTGVMFLSSRKDSVTSDPDDDLSSPCVIVTTQFAAYFWSLHHAASSSDTTAHPYTTSSVTALAPVTATNTNTATQSHNNNNNSSALHRNSSVGASTSASAVLLPGGSGEDIGSSHHPPVIHFTNTTKENIHSATSMASMTVATGGAAPLPLLAISHHSAARSSSSSQPPPLIPSAFFGQVTVPRNNPAQQQPQQEEDDDENEDPTAAARQQHLFPRVLFVPLEPQEQQRLRSLTSLAAGDADAPPLLLNCHPSQSNHHHRASSSAHAVVPFLPTSSSNTTPTAAAAAAATVATTDGFSSVGSAFGPPPPPAPAVQSLYFPMAPVAVAYEAKNDLRGGADEAGGGAVVVTSSGWTETTSARRTSATKANRRPINPLLGKQHVHAEHGGAHEQHEEEEDPAEESHRDRPMFASPLSPASAATAPTLSSTIFGPRFTDPVLEEGFLDWLRGPFDYPRTYSTSLLSLCVSVMLLVCIVLYPDLRAWEAHLPLPYAAVALLVILVQLLFLKLLRHTEQRRDRRRRRRLARKQQQLQNLQEDEDGGDVAALEQETQAGSNVAEDFSIAAATNGAGRRPRSSPLHGNHHTAAEHSATISHGVTNYTAHPQEDHLNNIFDVTDPVVAARAKAVVTALSLLFLGFYTAAVAVAPKGNPMANSLFAWVIPLQPVRQCNPRWFHPLLLWLPGFIYCVALAMINIFIPVGTDYAVWISALTLLLGTLTSVRIQFVVDGYHREEFLAVQRAKHLHQQLEQDYHSLENVMLAIAPKGIAAALVKTARDDAVADARAHDVALGNSRVAGATTTVAGQPTMARGKTFGRVIQRMKGVAVFEQSRLLITHATNVHFLLVQLQHGSFSSSSSSSGLSVEKLRSMLRVVLQGHHRTTKLLAQPRYQTLEILKADADTMLIVVGEPDSTLVAVKTLFLFSLELSSQLRQIDRLRHRMVLGCGPALGGVFGASSVSFEYYGSALCIGQRILQEAPMGATIVTTATFAHTAIASWFDGWSPQEDAAGGVTLDAAAALTPLLVLQAQAQAASKKDAAQTKKTEDEGVPQRNGTSATVIIENVSSSSDQHHAAPSHTTSNTPNQTATDPSALLLVSASDRDKTPQQQQEQRQQQGGGGSSSSAGVVSTVSPTAPAAGAAAAAASLLGLCYVAAPQRWQLLGLPPCYVRLVHVAVGGSLYQPSAVVKTMMVASTSTEERPLMGG